MAKKNYSELLKDPRWQKKRLEILNRDNFKCRSCGDDQKTLHVHHLKYDNCFPWEAENDNLIILCEECHKTWHIIYDNNELDSSYIILVTTLMNDLEYQSIKKWLDKNK